MIELLFWLPIHARDGVEPFKSDKHTIVVCPIWIDATKVPAPAMRDVLLYAEGKIYVGWNESTEPEEDPVYCIDLRDSRSAMVLEGVTHWMILPEKPS
jgi:hypothetical protein